MTKADQIAGKEDQRTMWEYLVIAGVLGLWLLLQLWLLPKLGVPT